MQPALQDRPAVPFARLSGRRDGFFCWLILMVYFRRVRANYQTLQYAAIWGLEFLPLFLVKTAFESETAENNGR